MKALEKIKSWTSAAKRWIQTKLKAVTKDQLKVLAIYVFILLSLGAISLLSSCKTTATSIDKTSSADSTRVTAGVIKDSTQVTTGTTSAAKATTDQKEKLQEDTKKETGKKQIEDLTITFTDAGGSINLKTGQADGVKELTRNTQIDELTKENTQLKRDNKQLRQENKELEEHFTIAKNEIQDLSDSLTVAQLHKDITTEKKTDGASWYVWLVAGIVIGVLGPVLIRIFFKYVIKI